MGKPHTKIEKKLQNSFWENGKKNLKNTQIYLDLTFKDHPRSKIMRWTERLCIIYNMCFIQTLVITCTVSEILVKIDPKYIVKVKIGLSDLEKWHLERFRSLHILAQHCYYPNEASSCKTIAQHFGTIAVWWPSQQFNENQNFTGRQYKHREVPCQITRNELDLISLLSTFHVNWSQYWPNMTSYGLDEWFWAMFEPTWIWPNFTFGQLFMWIGANNYQIWLTMG